MRKNLVYLAPKRVLFLGNIPKVLKARLASPALLVSLKGELELHCGERKVVTKSILLQPGYEFKLTSRDGIIANFILDRHSGDLEHLRERMCFEHGGVYTHAERQTELIDVMRQIYQKEYGLRRAFELLMSCTGIDKARQKKSTIDPRVLKVTEEICRNPTINVTLDNLAKLVNLSSPRLVSLFKRDMGIPIRKYRAWRRIYLAAQILSHSANITQAALEAGFTDCSHFNKHFKEMFGSTPKDFMKRDTRIFVDTYS